MINNRYKNFELRDKDMLKRILIVIICAIFPIICMEDNLRQNTPILNPTIIYTKASYCNSQLRISAQEATQHTDSMGYYYITTWILTKERGNKKNYCFEQQNLSHDSVTGIFRHLKPTKTERNEKIKKQLKQKLKEFEATLKK